MVCPNCKNEMHCGCESCKPANEAKGLIVDIHDQPDSYACGNCGLRKSYDAWLDEEGRQLEAKENT